MCIFLVTVFMYVFGCACSEPNPYIEALEAKPWQSEQDYVEVRPGAFLFYWLYYADGKDYNAESKPLVILIEGGPSYPASGLANFAELGPLDMDMKPRNHTWVNGRNLLLIDHPVGTGFSYVTNTSLYVQSDSEMAVDLQRAIKAFYEKYKQFRKTPTYIIGQGYGGKLVPILGCYLHKAIQRNQLKMNFKGIGIGGGYVDPKETAFMQPQFLYMMGILDKKMYFNAMDKAKEISNYIDGEEYVKAQMANYLYQIMTSLNTKMNFNINLKSINKPNSDSALKDLEMKMNQYVKPTLSHIVDQSIQWRYFLIDIFISVTTQLKSSLKYLEMLLNDTKLKVAVFNGNMDATTPLRGALNWVHKLKWHGAEAFQNAERIPIRGLNNGYYKMEGQLTFWAVLQAGHWVPEDNPEAMEQILEHLMSENNA